jgi:hypothetical protein
MIRSTSELLKSIMIIVASILIAGWAMFEALRIGVSWLGEKIMAKL